MDDGYDRIDILAGSGDVGQQIGLPQGRHARRRLARRRLLRLKPVAAYEGDPQAVSLEYQRPSGRGERAAAAELRNPLALQHGQAFDEAIRAEVEGMVVGEGQC